MAIRCHNEHKIEHKHKDGPMRAVRPALMPEASDTSPRRHHLNMFARLVLLKRRAALLGTAVGMSKYEQERKFGNGLS